ncbi:nuclear transport factor 2 family protein [Yinghuangia seranimata]|uniref:nuclear transport factor 2 family protein n=1 Tax=Yinghuangia seranimata TaxID=408067 RepID=UPI00248BCED8|nr:nuclear transport factor 2 family protein [Yinghuangia seranimata]MDI2129873.1 nuclear transport factor 2 family protein [Yinghuangia seranimata]
MSTDTVVQRYLGVWNETDPAIRRAAIDDVFAAEVTYTDPLAAVAGRDALDALVGQVHEQFPGFVFRPHGRVDAHHDLVRFQWGLGPAGTEEGEPPVIGFDVVALDADGRVRSVHGFLDKVPA